MANILSQKKRDRQNIKRRLRNSMVRSSIRTATKNANKAIEAKNKDIDKIDEEFKKFVKTIDGAVQKGMVHKSTAARKKSRLARKINQIKKTS
ncbi:30S ribosomal protein S20 [Spirochaetota bacterium]